MATYIVKPGDTLESIAKQFSVPVESIIQDNHLFANNKLSEGQSLIILEEKPYIEVNGYAYPSIDVDALNASLPYLTYVSVFSYNYDENGYLLTINDQKVLDMVSKSEVKPLLTITNIKPGDNFSSQWAHMLFTSETMQANLLKNLLELLTEKNYYGVNVDFELVLPEDKDLYNAFLTKVANLVHEHNMIMTTAVMSKVRADQPGIYYGGTDYNFHGEIADLVMIMTYGWGYSSGKPTAIAPVNEVKRVLDYAVTAIPPEKILMGIPTYGYDWEIPYIKGTNAKSLSFAEAGELAKKYNSVINYDTKFEVPYFNYTAGGQSHQVWFEDVRSLDAKLKLVSEYNLGGISYWNLDRFFTTVWKAQEKYYNVKKI